MRLLLDTHILLWAVDQPGRLPPLFAGLVEDGANDVIFSSISILEIAIKFALKRKDFTARPDRIAQGALEIGFRELPVLAKVASLVADLPSHHRDPFDRLLVVQAIEEPARLLTSDATLPRYSELVWFQPA